MKRKRHNIELVKTKVPKMKNYYLRTYKSGDIPRRDNVGILPNEQVEQTISSPKDQIMQRSKTITSVRVTKYTRNKLNSLIQLGQADNVDILIDILLDEYIKTNLEKDEKKTFKLILDIIQKRDR